jgi:predicted PurR-regulated permease PerM
MAYSRDQIIRFSSFVLTGLALLAILELHLLVPFLCGLLVYELVVSFTPFAQRFLPSRRGKLFTVGLFSAIVVAAIVGAVLGLVSFFHHDVQNLPKLLVKVAEILDHVRAEIPAALAQYLPDDIADLQASAIDWLRAHVAELRMIGAHTLVTLAETIIALVIGAVLSLREAVPHSTPGPLAVELTTRAQRFSTAFHRVALSQLSISLLNTTFSAIYLLAVLPMCGVHLPLSKTMVAITFVAGLLPVVGNLISNTIVVIVSLDHSLAVAIASLAFLVGIHKLEYVLGARITGTRIKAQIWELLVAMMAMEAMFGVPGLVAAPIYYAYLKRELLEAGLI